MNHDVTEEHVSESTEEDPSDASLESTPKTPFTNMLNALESSPAKTNDPLQDAAQSSMGLLQMFPTHDEDDLVWDNYTPPLEFNASWNDVSVPPIDHEPALRRRILFVADDDCDNDEESLTSEDTGDDVFNDPSILEISLNGTRKFNRSRAVRRQRYQPFQDTDTGAVEDDEDDGYAAEAEDDPIDDNDGGSARPRRKLKTIDYALFHRCGQR